MNAIAIVSAILDSAPRALNAQRRKRHGHLRWCRGVEPALRCRDERARVQRVRINRALPQFEVREQAPLSAGRIERERSAGHVARGKLLEAVYDDL